MKTPEGILIWLAGTAVTTPGSGEQKRGAYTGELVWLEAGVEVESPTQPAGSTAVLLP